MDWELESKNNSLVNEKHEGWIWEHVATSSEGRTYGRAGKIGEILRQEIYDCAFCRGTGVRPAGSKCPVCKGRETIKVQPPAVVCAFCKGTGEEIRGSAITCSVCKGKGVVSVQEPIKICPNCRGRGRPIGSSLYCMTCKGKGVVTVKVAKEGEAPTIRRPSGSEWEAFQIIYELGQAGRHGIGGKMHVGAAYADYVCKSLLNKGLIERKSRDVYVISEAAKKAFAERLEEEKKKAEEKRKEEEKKEKNEEKVNPIDTKKLQEFKIL